MDTLIALMWCCAAVSIMIPVALWVTGRLAPVRDYFFLLLYGQAIIYLHVAPTIAAAQIEPRFQTLYLYLQVAALLLFELPCALLYLRIVARPLPESHDRFRLQTSNFKGLLLAALAVGYSSWFVWTVVTRGLLFMRVGPEGVLDRYEDLPVLVWAGYRLFSTQGGVLSAAILIALLRSSNRFTKLALGTAWLVTVSVFGANEFFNNRLQSIILVVVTAGMILYFRRPIAELRRWRIAALGTAAALLALYATKVVSVIRSNYLVYGEARAEWFNPFYRSPVAMVGEDTPLYLRLNGIDLMAQITPRALQDGFAHGQAWSGTLAPLILPFIDRDKANELKRTYATDAKVYLMQHYTTYESPDYFSSALMDAYGNFGLFGILLSAVCLATVCANGVRLVQFPGFSAAPLIGVWLLYLVLPFERPLITLFGNGLRFSPMILILLAFNPLRAKPLTTPDATATLSAL